MHACRSESGSKKASAPAEKIIESDTGKASFYGAFFDGRKTASGEIFDSRDLVAAHPVYPMGTIVRVTNLETSDTATVRIIDRGPTKENQHEGVIIDVSKGAGEKLKMIEDGRIRVRVDVLKWGTFDELQDTSP